MFNDAQYGSEESYFMRSLGYDAEPSGLISSDILSAPDTTSPTAGTQPPVLTATSTQTTTPTTSTTTSPLLWIALAAGAIFLLSE